MKIFSYILLVGLFLFNSILNAQWLMGGETAVEANSLILSQHQTNILNSNIEGDAVIAFKASSKQYITSGKGISIPHLRIHNAHVLLDNTMIVKGNLEIFDAKVDILSVVWVEGKFIRNENSLVFGEDLIISTSSLHSSDHPLTQNQIYFQLSYSFVEVISEKMAFSNLQTHSIIFFKKPKLISDINHPVNLPPPKNPLTRLRPGILV